MDILILAGGLGSRFFANSSKITVNFWGISVLDMISYNALKTKNKVYVVLRKDHVIPLLSGVKGLLQKNEYGTGAAVQSYVEQVQDYNSILVLPGDVPLIETEVMNLFQQEAVGEDIILGVMKTPEGDEKYGRIIIKDGNVVKIVEYKDHPEKTEYVNTGVIYLSKAMLPLVQTIQKQPKGEVYLTEIVEIAVSKGFKVKKLELNHEDALGFNTITEFHHVLNIAQQKWRKKALKSSAIFFDIDSVYLSFDTEFELGATVEPYCRFLPNVKIGPRGLIKAFTSVENCYINGTVGPFANIKSGRIEKYSEIGAFVEVNRSEIGKYTKIKHLAYIGDANIGENVNVGAGCVICNYDGKKKHKTKIQSKAFIGANSTLIAPLQVEKNAFLAAGGIYNTDVPEDGFAIARTKQINKKRNDIENGSTCDPAYDDLSDFNSNDSTTNDRFENDD